MLLNCVKIANNNSDYYYNSDIDFKTTYTDWEQYGLSEISRTSFDLSAKVLPDSQMTLENTEKDKVTTIPKCKRSYKCRYPLFTQEYFDKTINSISEEVQTCKILDKDGKRYAAEYKNVESSTGNLSTHLRDVHGIVSENDKVDSKKLRNSKITEFVQKVCLHPVHI